MAPLPTLPSPPTTSLAFKVHRHEPELIKPANPTPHEFKFLSDIDDNYALRFHVSGIFVYPNNPSMLGKDPVNVIREALAKTLVFYHPYAGRLRERPNNRLVVECTGEGILFIEADANVALDPPYPCVEELHFDVPGSNGIVNCPLLLIQVTRFTCGGFIFAIRNNHTISDGYGVLQFLSTVGEMARGLHVPSILPVWERSLLTTTSTNNENEQLAPTNIIQHEQGTTFVHRSFFFGPREISSLRKLVPPHLGQFTTFEILAACIWRCRTIALKPDPMEARPLVFAVSARDKTNPPLPVGYYGNCTALLAAFATAEELALNPLEYALEKVHIAKEEMAVDQSNQRISRIVAEGNLMNCYVVSDLRNAGYDVVDFGWGKPIYFGIARSREGGLIPPEVLSFYTQFKNKEGEKTILVPLWLPSDAMKRFAKELDNILKGKCSIGYNEAKFIKAAL